MAEAHLDHPGDVTWFAGHGPKQPLGLLCDHPCDHNFTCSVIGWGPDYEHYCLVECGECGCRGWTVEYPEPFTADRPKYRRRDLVQVAVPRQSAHRPSRPKVLRTPRCLMPEITHDCPRDGETVTLCCGRSPFELPRSDRMTLDSALVTCRRDTDSDTAFRAAHQGHDVGWRHEDGRLYSATCHDCDVRYTAPENAET